MRPNKFLATVAVAALTTVTAGAVSATTINDVFISSVTGVWTGTTGTTASGLGTSEISWGQPATNAGQSGYSFTGIAPSGPWEADEVFDLGTFTHNNQPIFAPSITSATLQVTTEGTVGGANFSVMSTFLFDHFETPNGDSPCAAGGANPCPDLVTPVTNPDSSTSVNVDGVEYFISVTGFNMGNSFLTLEEQVNTATLRGTFTADVPPIPLPAAGWLMLAGIGGLAALRRRKKAMAA